MFMTINDAAQRALDVQNACNLSGVVATFREITSDVLCPLANELGKGTDFVNRHPVSYMFTYKLMALTGNEPLSDWEVYATNERQCMALARGGEPEPIGVYAHA